MCLLKYIRIDDMNNWSQGFVSLYVVGHFKCYNINQCAMWYPLGVRESPAGGLLRKLSGIIYAN